MLLCSIRYFRHTSFESAVENEQLSLIPCYVVRTTQEAIVCNLNGTTHETELAVFLSLITPMLLDILYYSVSPAVILVRCSMSYIIKSLVVEKDAIDVSIYQRKLTFFTKHWIRNCYGRWQAYFWAWYSMCSSAHWPLKFAEKLQKLLLAHF